MKYLSPATLIIVAAAIGLLFARGGSDLMMNIQYGNIPLADRCNFNSNDDWYCGIVLPYRWLLAGCIAIAAGASIWDRTRSN